MSDENRKKYHEAIDRIYRATDREIDEAMDDILRRQQEVCVLRPAGRKPPMPSNEADIRNAALEAAAKVADEFECSLADYGDSVDAQRFYEGGMLDAGIGIAAAIRALKSGAPPAPEPKPFTFKDPGAQREHERLRTRKAEER